MKSSISGLVVFIQVIIIITFFFSSCEKNESDSSGTITTSGATLKTTVTGRITDTNGNIVSGVTVKMGSITTVSDIRGYFLFVNSDVPKDRFVLVASKSGYFNCVSGKKTQNRDANYINLMMQELPAVVNIQSSTGGVVNITGGAIITFPANAFVDQSGNAYNGQVNVYSRHINPGAANFEAIVPGGDLLGVNTLGEEQSLYSLGMVETKLYDNTGINEVKLAAGITAAIKFPIDPSQNAVAQSTIPLWHLDEVTGIWQEDGQATKSGNFYTGNVSHFSVWNCDYPGERTDIKGLVVDCQNNPMSNIIVTINGFQNVITDNLGIFTTWVPVGYLIECQVLQSNNPFLSADSPVQSITAMAGQLNIIPTLVVPCATRISGTLKACGGNLNSSGFVYATWNGGARMQYTNTGLYELFVPENTSVNIIASTSGFEGNISVLTGTQNTNITAPDIELCSAGGFGQNRFTLNIVGGAPTDYLVDNITTDTDYIDNNGDGVFDLAYIYIHGNAIPGNYPCHISIEVYAIHQVDDYFPLELAGIGSFVYIDLDSVVYESGSSMFGNTSNKLFFTDYGSPGGFTSGTFEFDWAIGSSGTNVGYITNGEFSVIREN